MAYTLFYGGVFSNWHQSDFTWKDIVFTCGEQYMMFRKALLFKDTDSCMKILKTIDPKEQKALGRKVKNYDDATWAAIREDVMVEGLFEKFNQNRKLKAKLLATGDTTLAEASKWDCVWGIGLTAEDPLAQDMKNWRGQNLLGNVLMRVRDQLNTPIEL